MDNKVINNLILQGAHIFGEILDSSKATDLYKKMRIKRAFGKDLFLTEQEYLEQKNHLNSNPTKDRNFLNNFTEELAFVEQDKVLQNAITSLLGDDYEVVIKKAICGVPLVWLPSWVAKKIENINVANLGAYIKPEYRDITYFRGIDYHQDIIDWPQGTTDLDPATFVTLYVYLHNVGEFDSPLYLLPKSHKLGATLFPHKLKKQITGEWLYQDENDHQLSCEEYMLTGKAGFVGIWHNCTLHGTQPVKNEAEEMRISLRYLLAKSNTNKQLLGIDDVNASIKGNLSPIFTREDLDKKGKSILKGNIINQ